MQMPNPQMGSPMGQPMQSMNQPMTPPPARPMGDMGGAPAPRQRPSKMPWVILIAVVVVVLVVLGIIFRTQLGFSPKQTEKLSGYQAVFLTNGQVYFGKLADADGNYVKLTDIFYLQVNQPLQTGQNGQGGTTQTPTAGQQQTAATANSTANQQTQLSLVKLGNELHGPADEMYISRSQILFYENLKADGQVAQAIAKYNANPTAANAPAADQTQQQQAPAQQTPTQQAPNQPAQTPPAK